MVLVAGGLGLPPPAPERPGFTFSGRLRASDSTTIATTFASADADRDAGWAWALTSSLRGAKQAPGKGPTTSFAEKHSRQSPNHLPLPGFHTVSTEVP